MDKNPNSKVITIRRAGSFLERAQGPEISEYYAMSSQSIGSQFEGKTSTRIWSGLSYEEEAILMPLLVDSPPGDNNFRNKVRIFFEEIDTKVPSPAGITLEIGLTNDNNQPLSLKNMPINPSDFVRWRHARGHKWVAKDKSEADGNPNKIFYIFDPANIASEKNQRRIDQDASITLYLQISKDPKQVDMVLSMLGVDIRSFSGKDVLDQKLDVLKKLAEDKPEKFIATGTHQDLEVRAWLENMVRCGILKRVGERFVDTETNKVLGNSLEETIFFINDDVNVDQMVALKARTQEAMRVPAEDVGKTRQTKRKDGTPLVIR
jgi:hypothetical protein